jgi:ABC-type multidrug transport system fused ATPase/permease subunit
MQRKTLQYTLSDKQLAASCGSSHCAARCALTLTLQILRRNIGWFDQPAHSTGALTTQLALDARAVSRATGTVLRAKVQMVTSVLAGLLIGLRSCWQIGIVAVLCVPLIGK